VSTLGAAKIHKLALDVPLYGAWRADVVLEQGAVPSGKVTLTAGDLSLAGTVLRADVDAPSKPHAVVVGGLGWETTVATPPSYQSDAGVKLSSVLKDLAARANETIEQPADVVLGSHYAYVAARPTEAIHLRDVLAALHQAGHVGPWRVDSDGVTRFGMRAGVAVPAATRATEMRKNSAVGLLVEGIDAPAAFMPGNTLGGKTVRRLVVNETAGSLTVELYVDAPSIKTSALRWVAEAFPALIYGHPRTYRVFAVRGDKRLDLEPPPDAKHLPELPAVEQWALGGALVTPKIGAEVAVFFLDANPSRPRAIAFAPSTPDEVAIDADAITLAGGDITDATGLGRVVRYGDPIVFGAPGPGTVSPGAVLNHFSKVKA
jgi:hypothetical protein